jgi:hypothetical protein
MNESEFFAEFSEGTFESPPMTALGIPLDGEWTQERSGVPCDALVISRSMLEGNFSYQIITNKGLGAVDCLGMLRWAQMVLEAGMFINTEATLTPGEDDDEGEAA